MQVVLADDFTGAAEIAGIAWRSGRRVVVSQSVPERCAAEVLVLDTDSRLLTDEAAATRVGEFCGAVRALIPEGAPVEVFKKIDSVLRGPVAAEIGAALAGLGKERAVVLSANPSKGRVIRGGRYFVEGVPLHQTGFASDPLHPARSNRVRDRVGDSLRIETPDAATLEDVSRVVTGLEPGDLPVGGADYFAAWCGSLSEIPIAAELPGRRLWVCGSQASREGRERSCREHAVAVVEFDSFSEERWIAGTIDAFAHCDRVVMEISRESPLQPAELLAALGRAGKQVIDSARPEIVFVEGGATSASLLAAMGWTRFEVTRELGPGVVGLLPVDDGGRDRPIPPEIVVKPGSYPWPDLVFAC